MTNEVRIGSTLFLVLIAAHLAASASAETPRLSTADLPGSAIIPADRMTLWRPGVTYNGGIPNRTTIFRTLSPRGGTQDDTAQIQAALNSCPPEQVVQLTVGTFNVKGGGIQFRNTNCTLRGAGPGALPDGRGGTRIIKADRDTNTQFGILYVGPGDHRPGMAIDLAQDGAKDSYSLTLAANPGLHVGEIILVDQNTNDHPEVVWGSVHNPPGGISRSWFSRQDRSLTQILEIVSVNGNTITFNTPLHATFYTRHKAQLARFMVPFLRQIGIENLYIYGGMGGHGNIAITNCAYCWVKNVNAHWAVGPNVSFRSMFRSELRDSYIHETPNAHPGGGGYQTSIDFGTSDSLFENNIIWYGNKVIVMRATGGGNVISYNYFDDAFGAHYPHLPEAGLTAGHYTTPHMELLEGNYSHNYKGDSYWGNSINITVFRNWLSAKRGAHSPLDNYTSASGHCIYRYGDYAGRTAVDIQAYSYNTSFVGNVLGIQNQQLMGYESSCFGSFQTGWTYENLGNFRKGNIVVMWNMGEDQSHHKIDGKSAWVADTYKTQLREGNWDWVTKSQRWHGMGGTGNGDGPAKPIPNSLYLSSPPPFFAGNTWPWIDPRSGATHTLPAKHCFEQKQMPTCLLSQNR